MEEKCRKWNAKIFSFLLNAAKFSFAKGLTFGSVVYDGIFEIKKLIRLSQIAKIFLDQYQIK